MEVGVVEVFYKSLLGNFHGTNEFFSRIALSQSRIHLQAQMLLCKVLKVFLNSFLMNPLLQHLCCLYRRMSDEGLLEYFSLGQSATLSAKNVFKKFKVQN